jgi:hypothetical protein
MLIIKSKLQQLIEIFSSSQTIIGFTRIIFPKTSNDLLSFYVPYKVVVIFLQNLSLCLANLAKTILLNNCHPTKKPRKPLLIINKHRFVK